MRVLLLIFAASTTSQARADCKPVLGQTCDRVRCMGARAISAASGFETAARGRPSRWAAALLEPIDGAWLAAFRALLGLVVAASVLRFALYDRIDPLFVTPDIHFTYWGFSWVRPLPGSGMHTLIGALAVLALCVAAGLLTRITSAALALGFAYLQLIDVATYLNHYYLLTLLLGLLAIAPAGRCGSIDAWQARRARAELPPSAGQAVPAVWLYLFRFQIALVYLFAALAKAHADWLVHGQPLRIWLSSKTELPVLGAFFAMPSAALWMSWAGFLFDASIAGLLLWPRARRYAYGLVIGFHAMTYLLFPMIGMFPLVMITGTLVFFSPSWPRIVLGRARLRHRPVDGGTDRAKTTPVSRWQYAALALGVAYCTLQIALPLRFLAYGGNVLWHEQGMRFSWRVMVREKGSSVSFVVRSPTTGQVWHVTPDHYCTPLQEREMSEQPDLILQLAHHIRDDFSRRGLAEVEVRAEARVSLNGRANRLLIDPNVDLARIEDSLAPASWILPAPTDSPAHNHAAR
jgi:vitamin K-dependent gamma-carboxylase